MGRTISVLMAFDRGYLFPSCVAIHSVLEQADPADRYRFYILTAEENVGMDDGFFELLAAKFPNFAWEYRPVAVDMFLRRRRMSVCRPELPTTLSGIARSSAFLTKIFPAISTPASWS